MKRSARSPSRLLAVIVAAVAILALGGWMSANAGTPGASGANASVSWCCTDGTSPGVTVTGQAIMHGRGTSARDDAIARAVADATDQANAAAHAAGVTLGSIVDLQVSAPPYPYAIPVSGAAAEPGSMGSGSSGSSDASVTSASACPLSAPCSSSNVMLPYNVDATVTITWSIA